MPTTFQLREAVRRLRRGGIVAYPTEAVYGLGCDPLNGPAVKQLLALKGRPASKGLILVAAGLHQLRSYLALSQTEIPDEVLASWPGPHTWLLPAAPFVPWWITGGHHRIAVRVTAHPVAAELCRRFGGPLVSTSANVTDRPPARNPLQVRLRCPGSDLILHGATGSLDNPTPIRDALT
jgi:L-threonylcarbamoyladenylate synthase